MRLVFDIFRVDQNGALFWCDAVSSLEIAKLRIESFGAAHQDANRYLIFNQNTRERTLVTPSEKVSKT